MKASTYFSVLLIYLAPSIPVNLHAQLDNSPPVISDNPDHLLAEGSTHSTNTLDNYVSDPDNLNNNHPWTAKGQRIPSGTITNTMANITETSPKWNGNETISFTAEDSDASEDSVDVQLSFNLDIDSPIYLDTILKGESVNLKLDNVRGDVQWQQSSDQVEWYDIIGGSADSLSFYPESSAYFRSKIIEGTCDPIFSSTIYLCVESPAYNGTYWFRSNNPEFPIMGFHEDSSVVTFIQDTISNNYVGISYQSTINSSAFIVMADDNGYPSIAYYEEYIFLYENYTDSTVDVAIIDPNSGIQIAWNISIDSDEINNSLKSYSSTAEFPWAEVLRWGGHALRFGACAASIASIAVPNPVSVGAAALTCTAFVAGVISDAKDSDNPEIEQAYTLFGVGAGLIGCGTVLVGNIAGLLDCAALAVDAAGLKYQKAELDMENREDEIESGRSDLTNLNFGTFIDLRDDQEYNWVKIGNQTWMAENLKATQYADGNAIPLVTDGSEWFNLGDNNVDRAYCYYGNDENSIYGVLYTWAAAMNGAQGSNSNPSEVQGVCPNGWHLPSYDEWLELLYFVRDDGHSGNIGTALKASSEWLNNGNGTDNYGFSALPGGRRAASVTGDFRLIGNNGFWWTTQESSDILSTAYIMNDTESYVNYAQYQKSTGNSVRCVKDE